MPETTKYKTIGDSAPVGQTSVSSPSALASRPNVSVLIGTDVPMQRAPMASPSSLERKGTYQLVGDSAPVSQDPNKVVGNSAMLPTSDTAKFQTEIPKVIPNEVRR